MNTYRIENTFLNRTLGEFEGDTESEALDAFARYVGFENYAELDGLAPSAPGVIKVTLLEQQVRTRRILPDYEAECVYCGRILPSESDVRRLEDHEAWSREAEQHEPGCEWVKTRAFRRAPVEIQITLLEEGQEAPTHPRRLAKTA